MDIINHGGGEFGSIESERGPAIEDEGEEPVGDISVDALMVGLEALNRIQMLDGALVAVVKTIRDNVHQPSVMAQELNALLVEADIPEEPQAPSET